MSTLKSFIFLAHYTTVRRGVDTKQTSKVHDMPSIVIGARDEDDEESPVFAAPPEPPVPVPSLRVLFVDDDVTWRPLILGPKMAKKRQLMVT